MSDNVQLSDQADLDQASLDPPLRATSLIKLTRTDPARNMHRFYALQLTATLFGEWALIAEWGRIGAAGQVQERVFAAPELAEAALAQRQHAKMRRGYRAP
jgi:predicted DNA-binding WGR domain protein